MKSRLVGVATGLVVAVALSGCASSTNRVIQNSSVSIAVDTPFTSYNPHASSDLGETNEDVSYATGSGFTYYNNAGELVRDESFGRYEKLDDNPLTVEYTIADGARWSDGAAVDAADLLLEWVASSGAENTRDFDPKSYIDPATGLLSGDLPADIVYFTSPNAYSVPYGIKFATAVPQVSEDRKSITLVYDEPFADWESAFYGLTASGLPAHIVASQALSTGQDIQRAKDAMIAAIVGRDEKALSKIAASWNTGFTLSEESDSRGISVSSGPYTASDVAADGSVTLTASPTYSGSRQPVFEQVRLRYIPDSIAAVQALNTGEVQLVRFEPSQRLRSALGQSGATVTDVQIASFEHIDLQFDESRSGHFRDARVRQAFLKTIPRAEIARAVLADGESQAAVRNSFTFHPGSGEYEQSVADNGSAAYLSPDIPGAQALLAEAAVSDPEVCVLYDASDSDRVKEFSLIQASAAAAGFVVTDCGLVEWRAALGQAGAYDAALFSWSPAGFGANASTLPYSSTSATNLNRYDSPVVDSLLASLDSTASATHQSTTLGKIDKALFDDFYGLPLFQHTAIFAYDSVALSGVSASALPPGALWNMWEWAPPAASR